MTGSKSRTPTNKEFKRNFQGLAGTRTRKGHLNNKEEKKASDMAKLNGLLIRVEKEKFDKNGWEVQVGEKKDAKTYMCSYQEGILNMPDFTETKKYYVMKGKVNVEISIDKKSKVYSITKINSLNKKPLFLYNNTLRISVDSNTKTNQNVEAKIELTDDSVDIKGDSITVTDSDDNKIDLIEENKKADERISELEEQNKSLLEKIQIIEEKLDNSSEESDNSEDEGD